MPPRQRAAAPADDPCGGEVHATELDTQSAEFQRAMAARRRRAAAVAHLREQHAKQTPPLPIWLSLLLIAAMVWGFERMADRLWGLEEKLIPAARV